MLGLLVGAAVASKMITAISDTAKTRMQSMQGMIFINSDAESFEEENYLDVIHNLQGMGFTNINVNEIRKHNKNFFTRNLYGKVESVSINGKSDFAKGTMFPPGAYVVISFHVYKDSPRVEIPELYGRPMPSWQQFDGHQQSVNVNVNIQNEHPEYTSNPKGDYRNYEDTARAWFRCEYCGSMIPNSRGFCPRCGAPLGR